MTLSNDELEADQVPSYVRTSSREPMSDGLLLGIAVAGVFLLGDVVLKLVPPTWLNSYEGLFFFVTLPLLMAWQSGAFGLLSIWLGMGRGPLCVRVVLVGGAVAAIEYLVCRYFAPGTYWSGAAFADTVLEVAVVAVPFGLLRLFGFELWSSNFVRFVAERKPEFRSGQFSLRQLFDSTVSAAIVAAIARFAEFSHPRLLIAAAAVYCLGSLGPACAAWMPRRTKVAVGLLFCCAAIVSGVAAGFEIFTDKESTLVVAIAISAAFHVLFLSFVLLLYRRLGYRIRRRRLSLQPGSQVAIGTDEA